MGKEQTRCHLVVADVWVTVRMVVVVTDICILGPHFKELTNILITTALYEVRTCHLRKTEIRELVEEIAQVTQLMSVSWGFWLVWLQSLDSY